MLGSLGQASELLPPGNSGGLWGPVRVVNTGSVRILDLRVATVGASEQRAVVTLQADLDAADAGLVWLHTSIGEIDHVGDHVLAAGLNRVEWRVVVPRPRRWWPHRLGDQPQYEVSVEARTGEWPPERPAAGADRVCGKCRWTGGSSRSTACGCS